MDEPGLSMPRTRSFTDSTGYWRLEVDCGPCVRIVDGNGDPVTEWVYPTDIGLPRYCDNFNEALLIVAGEAARRMVVKIADESKEEP